MGATLPYIIRYLLVIGLLFSFSITYAVNKEAQTTPAWVYQELNYFYQKGIIKDYPWKWIAKGNKLSRFELAYYIKKIIEYYYQSPKKSPKSMVKIKRPLQKLVEEFQKELAILGLKSTKLNHLSLDFNKMTPTLRGYRDLDEILIGSSTARYQEPFYYFAGYYKGNEYKTFIFLPENHLKAADLFLLENTKDKFSILYHQKIDNNLSFLVLKGELPIEKAQMLQGYFLFPLEKETKGNIISLGPEEKNDMILSLLNEVHQLKKLDNLSYIEGSIALGEFTKENINFSFAMKDRRVINGGLTLGGILVYDHYFNKKDDQIDLNKFGLPLERQILPLEMDLDRIDDQALQSIEINIQGKMSFSPQTSLFGGLDLIYQEPTSSEKINLWPAGTKASAGVQHQFNNYWTVMTYQSLANTQLKKGLLSTTSLGVKYDDWISLWLAYQFVDFDEATLSGTLMIQF